LGKQFRATNDFIKSLLYGKHKFIGRKTHLAGKRHNPVRRLFQKIKKGAIHTYIKVPIDNQLRGRVQDAFFFETLQQVFPAGDNIAASVP
jgi:hypothetical protein